MSAQDASPDAVDDGFGNRWARCGPDCDLQVVRPGSVQCRCAAPTVAELWDGEVRALAIDGPLHGPHITHVQHARIVMGREDLTDEQVSHVLWQHTPFPMLRGGDLVERLREVRLDSCCEDQAAEDAAGLAELKATESGWPAEGRLRTFPRPTCQSAACGVTLTYDGTAAYLHRDRTSGKLVVFCGACSQQVQLHDALRFPLVAL